MNTMNELKEAVDKVLETANNVIYQTNTEIYRQAPFIVRQMFLLELANITERNKGKKLNDVPEAVDAIIALSVLEKCYPDLKKDI